MVGIKNGGKWLFGFLMNEAFQGPWILNYKISQNLFDFFEIVCNDKYSEGSKSDCFFHFWVQLIMLKEPLLDIFDYKSSILHISCFIVLFFQEVLVLEPRV